jgi:alkylation response protein AidB-like acyl-CoA dehydrogenase
MSENLDAIRQLCADIAKRVDRKYMAEQGRKCEPATKLMDLWVETGLLGIALPEEYGGIGGDMTDLAYAIDLLGQEGLFLGNVVPNFMSRIPLIKYGTQEQKDSILPATASGEAVFSFAITEPDAGTNTFKIRTTALKQDDGSYVLNGTKHFITGFLDSTHCLVVARTEPYDPARRTKGITLFLVDPHAAGISTTQMDIGIHLPEKNYVVSFEDVRLPADSVLGEEGNGLGAMFDSLNPERMMVTAANIGQADYVLGKAADYARNRAPFDVPIGSYQSVQHPMAEAKVNIEAARALLYKATALFDKGGEVGLDANMAKYLSSNAYVQATNAAAMAFGGGFADMEQDIIPFFIQAKLNTVAPVNNNIVLSHIAQNALKLPKSY